MQKGLKQWDLIYPFLFNIVDEALNYIIKKANEKGLILGLLVGDDRMCLTHFQYTDDTFLFIP